MKRREFIRDGSLGILGLGLGACARTRTTTVSSPPLRPPVDLPLVEASWDRVIRTTVGLRPHRDSGFVLRAERLDEKTLIHNYGHGGAGMSLSWGTGQMAAEMAAEHDERRAAVIGCGVVGLTSARQLQRRGFDVTIYAMSVPPDTTSNMSLASFTPTSGLVSNSQRTPQWDAQFRRAVILAFTELQLLAGRDYGVSWIDGYAPTESPSASGGGGGLLPPELRTEPVVLQPGEHPFHTTYARRFPSMRIEPGVYLDALVRDYLLFGGRIVIRRFDTRRDLATLEEPILVNCTGLGSLDLMGDAELVPVKGQLTHFVPQSEIHYQTQGGGPPGQTNRGGLGIHMMPRRDGIALGGTAQRGVWTLEPDREERQRIVDAHIFLFTSMRRSSGPG